MHDTLFARLFWLWMLFLLIGTLINHFRGSKLNPSRGYLMLMAVMFVVDLALVFMTDYVVPRDRGYLLGQALGSYLAMLVPVWFVAWRVQKRHVREAAQPPAQYRVKGYKDLGRLNGWVVAFLYAQVVVTALSSVVAVLTYRLALSYQHATDMSQAQLTRQTHEIERYQVALGGYFNVIYFISGLLMLRWMYRASFNAWQFDGPAMRHTPGWAVGSLLTPVLQLWKPYQVMREIWQVSHGSQPETIPRNPGLLRGWWALILVKRITAAQRLRAIEPPAEGEPEAPVNETVDASPVNGEQAG